MTLPLGKGCFFARTILVLDSVKMNFCDLFKSVKSTELEPRLNNQASGNRN